MKKLFITALLTIFLTGNVYAYTLSYDIPNPKAQRIKDAILALYPNTETYDHDADEDTPEIAKYTDNEWVVEFIRRYLINVWKRGEAKIARDALTPETDQDVSVTETP